MLSLAAALRQLKGFYQLFRCWIIGCGQLSKGKQSQRSQYCTSTCLYPEDSHIIEVFCPLCEVLLFLLIGVLQVDILSTLFIYTCTSPSLDVMIAIPSYSDFFSGLKQSSARIYITFSHYEKPSLAFNQLYGIIATT